VLVLLAGCGGDRKPSARVAAASASGPPATCSPPVVHRTPYPGHGKGLAGIPWIAGQPSDTGLVALLWYWPTNWPHVRKARIYTGGVAPAGYSTKVMWVFLGPAARARAAVELRIEGRRMDGPGALHDAVTGIGYEGSGGAPSYASIINVPKPGCWRLTLSTGSVRASVDVLAVRRHATASRRSG
jgi:hypothetical protein